MKISVISFTRAGRALSERIAEEVSELDGIILELYAKYSAHSGKKTGAASQTGDVPCKDTGEEKIRFVESSVGEWTKAQLQARNAMLFIGACGIAVRAVAPYLTDKLHDPPVLVMDEKGRYVIPILSGHVGGANELAELLAAKTGAQPVITTSTDLGGRFAVDLFAKRNRLTILNKEGIAAVSAKVLAGEKITLSIERGHIEEDAAIPEEVRVVEDTPRKQETVDVAVTSRKEGVRAQLILRPKEYVIGLGCKKGKPEQEIESFISRKLKELGILPEDIWALASVSLKKEEPGILAWCRKENILFLTYTPQELMETEGEFTGSLFVQEQVGVDNVCERAAVKACGRGGRLIAGKYAKDGMTIAVAKREWSVHFGDG